MCFAPNNHAAAYCRVNDKSALWTSRQRAGDAGLLTRPRTRPRALKSHHPPRQQVRINTHLQLSIHAYIREGKCSKRRAYRWSLAWRLQGRAPNKSRGGQGSSKLRRGLLLSSGHSGIAGEWCCSQVLLLSRAAGSRMNSPLAARRRGCTPRTRKLLRANSEPSRQCSRLPPAHCSAQGPNSIVQTQWVGLGPGVSARCPR